MRPVCWFVDSATLRARHHSSQLANTRCHGTHRRLDFVQELPGASMNCEPRPPGEQPQVSGLGRRQANAPFETLLAGSRRTGITYLGSFAGQWPWTPSGTTYPAAPHLQTCSPLLCPGGRGACCARHPAGSLPPPLWAQVIRPSPPDLTKNPGQVCLCARVTVVCQRVRPHCLRRGAQKQAESAAPYIPAGAGAGAVEGTSIACPVCFSVRHRDLFDHTREAKPNETGLAQDVR